MNPSTLNLPFEALLQALRSEGFVIGVDHHLRLQELLARVGGEVAPHELKLLLAPVFASDTAQQQRFYEVFDRCFPLFSPAGSSETAPGPETEPPHLARAASAPGVRQVGFFLSLLCLLGILALLVIGPSGGREKNPPVIAGGNVPAPRGRGAGSTVPGASGTNSPPPGSSPRNNGGNNVVREADTSPSTERPNPPAQPSFPSLPATPLPDPRLLDGLAWSAGALPLLVFAVAELLASRRRRMLLRRQRRPASSQSLPVHLPAGRLRLYDSEAFYGAARQLRRRQVDEFHRLDVPGSVAATVAAGGFPTLRYRAATRAPEYLMLIDRASFRDQQAALFLELARAFEREGLHVTPYFYEGDPRVCISESGERFYLDELARSAASRRLLLFGTGETLLDPLSGQPAGWTSIFRDWEDRALLSPDPPAARGLRELALSSRFRLLPATVEGLRELTGALEATEGTVAPPPRPSGEPRSEPARTGARSLDDVRERLGEPVFQWLCALAVYPELHWQLTLYLGSLRCMGPDLVTERNLLRLLGLPWLRAGALPDDVRLALLARLDPEKERAVRQAIVSLLEQSPPAKGVSADTRRLELAVQRWYLHPDRRRRRELRQALRRVPPAEARRDVVVLRALELERTGPLDLLLPSALRRILSEQGIAALGPNRLARALQALLLASTLAGAAAFALSPLRLAWAIRQRVARENNVQAQDLAAGIGERLLTVQEQLLRAAPPVLTGDPALMTPILTADTSGSLRSPSRVIESVSREDWFQAMGNAGWRESRVSGIEPLLLAARSNRWSIVVATPVNRPTGGVQVRSAFIQSRSSYDFVPYIRRKEAFHFDGTYARIPPFRHRDWIYSAAFSPNGRWAVTASRDKTARVWDAATGQPRTPPLRHGDVVYSAAFSLDGRWAVTASRDKTARVWDAATGQPRTPPLRHQDMVYSAAFSPDGRWVSTASYDHTAKVWDTATGQPRTPPLQHEAGVYSAAFSPDGKWVATASADHTARVWDATTGRPRTPPLQHEAGVYSAAFSPDGKWVVTASWDHAARVWDAATGAERILPLRHQDVVYSASFSPDGRWVVTASRDRTARVWDAATGQPRTPPLRHQDVVYSAAFSPDGKWVATASWDRTARVWDAATGQARTSPLQHQSLVYSAAFSPDGEWVVTASADDTARVWPAFRDARFATEINPRPPRLLAAFFTDPTVGWVVGEHGVILATTDGGHTWSRQRSGVDRGLYGAYFANPTTGWAVGWGGVILATTDGGRTWSRQRSGVDSGLCSVYFANPATGWIVGWGGVILATTDGGRTWSRQRSGTDQFLYSVCFPDPTTGWIVGHGGVILATADGGRTWSRRQIGVDRALLGVYFLDPTTGWIVGEHATILATRDGGRTWLPQTISLDYERPITLGSSRPLGDLWSVSFADEKTGWAAGEDGVIVVTTDGGHSWRRQESGVDDGLPTVQSLTPGVARVLGRRGMLLSTSNGGRTWSRTDVGPTYRVLDQHGHVVDLPGLRLNQHPPIRKGSDWRVPPVLDYSGLPFVRNLLAGRRMSELVEVGGDPHASGVQLASAARVPGTGWFVIVQQPKAVAVAPVEAQKRRVLTIGIAVTAGLALLWGALLWLGRRRPARGLPPDQPITFPAQ